MSVNDMETQHIVIGWYRGNVAGKIASFTDCDPGLCRVMWVKNATFFGINP